MSLYPIPAGVTSITANSRQVQPGALFLAYPGQHSDGRRYIADAIARGAHSVMWEKDGFDWQPAWQVNQLAVPQLAAQAGEIASAFYQQPSQQMWCIGVTGTNGKTTVTHWLAQAYRYLGDKAAVIGTLGNGVPGALQATQNTTPGAVDLQALLAGFVTEAVQVTAMEVSSHALDQGRVNGMAFAVAVLTNLTRDHLDYHQTMDAYRAAKRKLFDWPTLQTSVINADDAFGAALIAELRAADKPVLSYGLQQGDVRALRVRPDATGFDLDLQTPDGNASLRLPAIGQFNVYNGLAVLACLLSQAVPLDRALQALAAVVPVAGRMQALGGHGQPTVVVDYAHTPDALEKALLSLKPQCQGMLVCVFGCGGDRDPGKRAEMGRVAGQLADRVVLTSDNPRSESAQLIVDMIRQGVQVADETKVSVVLDRAAAIAAAIATAAPGDVVLVAGKGHEDYQECNGVRTAFSDAAHVQAALAQRGVATC